jgi:hypothetical protein
MQRPFPADQSTHMLSKHQQAMRGLGKGQQALAHLLERNGTTQTRGLGAEREPKDDCVLFVSIEGLCGVRKVLLELHHAVSSASLKPPGTTDVLMRGVKEVEVLAGHHHRAIAEPVHDIDPNTEPASNGRVHSLFATPDPLNSIDVFFA